MRSKQAKRQKPKQLHGSIAKKKRSRKSPPSQALIIRRPPNGSGGKVRCRPTLCIVNLPHAQRMKLKETLGQEGILYRTQPYKPQSSRTPNKTTKKAPQPTIRSLESLKSDPMAVNDQVVETTKDKENKGKANN